MVQELLGDEELARDDHLLLGCIAGKVDDLHAVEQRARDGIVDVRGRDEEDFGKIEGNLQVMIREVLVLLRVEDLEHRRGRVASKIRRHLVDFIQQEDRVAGARLAQALDDPPRHRPDVGAPVSTDLGLVGDAAKRHPDEFPTQCPGNGAAEAGLPHSGWPDEAEDRPFGRLGQLAHREELEDAFLDLPQTVVILVEDLLRGAQVGDVLAGGVPGKRDHQVEISVQHRDLRRAGRHPLQAVDVLEQAILDGFGQLQGPDALAHLVQLARVRLVPTELFLDDAHLFFQVELLLPPVDLLPDTLPDGAVHVENLDLPLQHR